MDKQANVNDGAATGTDTTPSPAVAAPPPDATATPAAPAATHGGQRQQAFAPAGEYATGVGGRRVLWPVAIGAASVVLAGQNLLNQVTNLISLFVRLVAYGPGYNWASNLGNIDAMSALSLLFGLIDLAMPILLLAAGILVWRQNRHGGLLHRIYAVIVILESMALSVIQANAWSHAYDNIRTEWLILPLLWATIRAVWPVFLLIWFARPNVKAEMRLWR
jgi:hypothetical protein